MQQTFLIINSRPLIILLTELSYVPINLLLISWLLVRWLGNWVNHGLFYRSIRQILIHHGGLPTRLPPSIFHIEKESGYGAVAALETVKFLSTLTRAQFNFDIANTGSNLIIIQRKIRLIHLEQVHLRLFLGLISYESLITWIIILVAASEKGAMDVHIVPHLWSLAIKWFPS